MIPNFKIIDLTHTIDEHIPTWTAECGFHAKILTDYSEKVRVLEYTCIASAGTHIDAPNHFIPAGRDIKALTLDELCAPACIIDMSEKMHSTAQITLQDIELYEKNYGKIPKGSVVIGHTGWSCYWNDPKKYRGDKEYPQSPFFSSNVAELLLQRDISGIGIDTFSPDPYGGDYPIHRLLLGADKFIIENLTNLEKLPKKGAYLLALPLKISEGTESPIRAIALLIE